VSTPGGRRVLVLNGPNLGRLGKREPSVYGTATYADLVELCESAGKELGLPVEVRQTEYEGELITWVHEACDEGLPVVLNAGALTHYSLALMDALKMRTAPPACTPRPARHLRQALRRRGSARPGST
jgi:3-dehydroquinate dehydratase II